VKILKIIKYFLRTLFILIILIFLTRSFLLEPILINDDRFSPLIQKGDYVIFQKIYTKPTVGDFVLTKRGTVSFVFGLPNDEIFIENDKLFINKKPFESLPTDFKNITSSTLIKVPDAHFFYFPLIYKLESPSFLNFEQENFYQTYFPKQSDIIGKLFIKNKLLTKGFWIFLLVLSILLSIYGKLIISTIFIKLKDKKS